MDSQTLIARTAAAGRNPCERVALMGDGTMMICYRFRAEDWALRYGGEIRPATAQEIADDDRRYEEQTPLWRG